MFLGMWCPRERLLTLLDGPTRWYEWRYNPVLPILRLLNQWNVGVLPLSVQLNQ